MKETSPKCNVCPIRNNPALCSLGRLVEKVYVDDQFASMPAGQNMITAEDEIRQKEITGTDIDRLTPKIFDDINLSLASCFTTLHEEARINNTTLATLTDDGRVAVAGCATQILRRNCEL